jgi:NAD-dependent deacetylase
LVFSGAGLSAPSGIPTFRDTGALWQTHDIDVVCNYITWKRNGTKVHDFHNLLRRSLPTYQPNAAHHMIAKWAVEYPAHIKVFTQNVDDMLERAGYHDSIKLHGDITKMQCTQCHLVWSVGYKDWDYGVDECGQCHSKKSVKPAIVMFYENAPEYLSLNSAMKDIHHRTITIVIGTSGVVVDIASYIFDKPGVKILNNLEPSPAINEDYFDHVFYESAHTACEKIDQLVQKHMNS